MKLLVLLLVGSLALNGCATTANDKNDGYGPDYREPTSTYDGPPVNIHYSQP
jgi:hypothetical protein